jgi:VCBS repeat-containing protein
VNVGDYSLEISGDEVVVRDESGAIVETVELDDVDGQLTLPDGQTVDLASLLADAGVENFQTAAGPANDNLGSINGGPANFTPFHGADDEFQGFGSEGTLGGTSLSYDTPANDRQPAYDPEMPVAVTWSSHDGWQVSENQGGVTFGKVVEGNPADFKFKVSDDRFEIVDGVLQLRDGVTFDYESESGIDLEITATSRTGDVKTVPVHIDVIDVNEAQSSFVIDGNAANENVAGAVIGNLTVADPDQGDQQTYQVSDSRFEVVNGQLKLKDGVSLDHESEPTVTVTVTATDKGGHQIQQTVTIQVGDVNEAQTSLSLDGNAVAENVTGAVIGTLAVTDPDAGDSQSFQVSDSRFEVVDGQLKLKDGVSLDHESEPSVNVTVTATDSAGHQIQQTFAIAVGDVNEAPTDIDLSGNAVVENVAGAVIGALSAIDPDAGDSHSFEVSDSRFEVVNGQLKLKDGVSLDFESEPSLNVTVIATDSAGNKVQETFSLSVGDVNEAQTALSLDHSQILENAPGAVVGALTVADPDAGDSQSFQVSDSRFEVVDGQLKLKDGVSLNHEAEPTVNVQVTATDMGGHQIQQTFSITVGDVNEAPMSLSLATDSTQLLVNGSFEADKLGNGQWSLFNGITGWKTGTQIEIQNNVTNKASDGAQVVEMDADKGVDTLYQDVQTVAGHAYELTFDTATRGDTKHTDAIEVYWNGVKIGTVDPQSTAWQSNSFQVIGTGGTDRIEFREVGGNNDNYGGLLDNVALKGMGNTVPENFKGVVIGTLSVTDPDAGDSHSFQVSDSRFEVVDGQLKLKSDAAFNYEAEKSVDVTVTATDSGGLQTQQTFTIKVGDVNEAQTALAWTGSAVKENTAGAVVGSLSVADPDAGDAQSFKVSDSRFEVVNNQLKLKAGVSLDFEQGSSVNVIVTATDKAGHQIQQTVTVNVQDVNEAQTGMSLGASKVAENASGAVVGTLTTTDPDAGDSQSYQVSDSRFEVVNNQLKLKSGVSLDFETEPSVTVKVTATDQGGHAIGKDFTVTVTNVNEAPTVTSKDGSAENHIVNTSTYYNPVASSTVGSYLYSNDSAGVAKPASNLLNGVAASNMTLSAATPVSVTFQKEAAGNHNMVGTYQYDSNGNIIAGSVKFVWLDATANSEGVLGGGMIKDFLGYNQSNTVSLGTMPAGTSIGFFAISNGANDGTNKTLLTNAAAGAANQTAAMNAIAGQLSIKVDANGNGKVYVGNSALNGETFFTHDKALNTDFNGNADIDHFASGVNASLPHQLVIGVEDLGGGGDKDFNDVVFSVDLGTYNVNKLTQSFVQPTVDFSDVDSATLSKAVIHTSGFQAGDTLNVPSSGSFTVTVDHGTADYTITIVGKTGNETVDQYEAFANSIYFSTSSKAEGERHIDYTVTDSGGLSSTVSTADIGLTNSYEVSTSTLGNGQTTLGSGDDLVHMNTGSTGPIFMGDGHDTVHLATQGASFGHNEAVKFHDVEAIDATGYGANKVSLSIDDVLNMTDGDNRLTITGETGDSVTLTGSGNNHWSVVESNAQFTTYSYNDGAMQAVVEISNQLNAQVS